MRDALARDGYARCVVSGLACFRTATQNATLQFRTMKTPSQDMESAAIEGGKKKRKAIGKKKKAPKCRNTSRPLDSVRQYIVLAHCIM